MTEVRPRSDAAGLRGHLADGAGVFLALNCGVCALVSLLALGGAFNTRLDILTHFAPLYGAAALGGMVAAWPLGARRRRWPAVFGALALCADAVLIAPEYLGPAEPRAPASAPGQIKVIQFNALRTNRDIHRVAAWLIAQNPDVVTLTETRHDLRDLLLRTTHWSVAGGHGSLMIFYREPRLAMERPHPRRGSKLAFVNATFPSASGPFEVVTAHLEWPTDRTHVPQQHDLSDVVRQRLQPRTILTGDFNTSPWSFTWRRTERRMGLIRRDGGLATFPATVRGIEWPVPVLPIDHVYAGPGWATVSVSRGPRLGSDHYPLVVVLAPRR